MRIVIDTSSLLALVRYYLPFDKGNSLKKFFLDKITAGEIIILDKVYEEAGRTAKGIAIKELGIDKKEVIKTTNILPSKKFFNRLENELCYGVQKNRLNSAEFEVEKNKFLDSADAKQILYCIPEDGSIELDNCILVTEETKSENDSKLFKKLPEICSILEIECCNLTTLFKDHFQINLSDDLK